MRRFIRLGDRTSHGGTVTSASSRMFVGGLPVACIGDTCSCPKKGHNSCVIVEGDDIMTVDGRAIALEGCKCSCGAVLISSMPNAGREYEGGDSAWHGGQALSNANGTAATPAAAASGNSMFDFDEHFVLIDDRTGDPVKNFEFHLAGQSEAAKTGVTDADGRTLLVQSKAAETTALRARQAKIVIG